MYFIQKKKEEKNNDDDHLNNSLFEYDENINDEHISIKKNILIIVYVTRQFKIDLNIKSEEND